MNVSRQFIADKLLRSSPERNALLLIIARVAGAFSALLFNLYLFRFLEIDDVGVVMTSISLLISITFLVTWGLEASSARFITRYRAHEALRQIRGYIDFSLFVVLASGAAIVATALAASAAFPSGEQAILSTGVFVAVGATLYGFVRIFSAMLFAEGRSLEAGLPQMLFLPVMSLSVLFVTTQLLGYATIETSLLAYLVAMAIAMLTQSLFVKGVYASVRGVDRDITPWKDWVKVSLFLGVPMLFLDFGREMAIIVGSLGLSSAELAVFALSLKLTAFLRMAVITVNQVFVSKMGHALAASDEAAFAQVLMKSALLKAFIAVCGCGAFLLFGEMILVLISPELEGYGYVAAILSLEAVALVVFGPAATVVSLSARPERILPVALTVLAIQCVGIFVGAQSFGVAGAACGFVAAWFLWSSILSYLLWRQDGRDVTIFRSSRDFFSRDAAG